MALSQPTAVPVMGTRRAVFIPAAADIDAVTVAEATAGTDISCYLTGGGFQDTRDQSVITDQRFCSAEANEIPGQKTKSLTLEYVYNLADEDSDAARIGLVEGTLGYVLQFLQKDEDDETYDVGDTYEAWPVRLGEQNPMMQEVDGLDRITQRTFKTGPVRQWKKLVAA